MQEIRVLKVGFHRTTLSEATDKVLKWLEEKNKRQIVTPNPEILLKAQENKKYLKVLNNADLSIADGTGILWAATYLSESKERGSRIGKLLTLAQTLLATAFAPESLKKILPERVTGVDLMKSICQQSGRTPIFLLGGNDGAANAAVVKLKEKCPELNVVGTYEGSPSIANEEKIIKMINLRRPTILFVAYGAPEQELWIARNLRKLNTVKIAMGVGGSFDFIAEKRKRAPQIMQKTGTEWLYRLIQEPKRIKRIYKAIVVFPMTVVAKTIPKTKISSIVSW